MWPRFGAFLADTPDFLLPRMPADRSTIDVLAMDYIDCLAHGSVTDAPQADRDRIRTLLTGLLLRELFSLHLMQTDPNFANDRYNLATNQLVLLDFGASCEFAGEIVQGFRSLMIAGMDGDHQGARQVMLRIGFFDAQNPLRYQDMVAAMFDLAMQPLRQDSAFDFGSTDPATRLRDMEQELGVARPLETDRGAKNFRLKYFTVPPTARLILPKSARARPDLSTARGKSPRLRPRALHRSGFR